MEPKNINIHGITPKSITTVIVALLAAFNVIARTFGFGTIIIENDDLYNVISGIFLIGTMLYTSYKNFNVTTASQKVQQLLELVKSGEVLMDDVDQLIENTKTEK